MFKTSDNIIINHKTIKTHCYSGTLLNKYWTEIMFHNDVNCCNVHDFLSNNRVFDLSKEWTKYLSRTDGRGSQYHYYSVNCI